MTKKLALIVIGASISLYATVYTIQVLEAIKQSDETQIALKKLELADYVEELRSRSN